MSSSDSYAASSVVSVTYGSMNVGLYHQDHERNATTYTPLLRVIRIVENMPDNVRRTLLAPILRGSVDPLTVYYMIRDLQIEDEEEILISALDFLRLVFSSFRFNNANAQPFLTNDENVVATVDNTEDETEVPPRLLNALLLMANNSASDSSSVNDEYSSVNPAQRFDECIPPVPNSRPPERTDCDYAIFIEPKNSKYHRFGCVGIFVLFSVLVVTTLILLEFRGILNIPTVASDPQDTINATTATETSAVTEQSESSRTSEQSTIVTPDQNWNTTTASEILGHDIKSTSAFKLKPTSTATSSTTPVRTTTTTILSTTATTTTTIEEEIKYLPGNIISWNGFEYMHSSKLQSWKKARETCGLWGGDLVSIYSKKENNLVYDLHKNGDPAWIGLTDTANEGHFVWTDGTNLKDFSAWDIDFGEPNNGKPKLAPENCVIQRENHRLSPWNDGSLWADEDCNICISAICKRKSRW